MYFLVICCCLFAGVFALPQRLPESRIVNGEDSAQGEWPWQISLQYMRNKSEGIFRHACGGSLIDENWVLTAAHCVEFDNDTTNFQIVLGEHILSSEQVTEQTVQAKKIIVHDGYESIGSVPDDIALIELSEIANTDIAEISTVALPSSSGQSFTDSDTCYISGWGKTSGTGSLADVLQHVEINVMTNWDCFLEWILPIPLSTHICVGGGDESACNGDSGGPLVCIKNKEYILAGLTSWGSPQCQGKPNVYTRISEYLTWISQNMN